MHLPPQEEWLTIKEVAKIYKITAYRVRHAYRVGRVNPLTKERFRLQIFHTFAGIITTRKLVEEFLQRLNG